MRRMNEYNYQEEVDGLLIKNYTVTLLNAHTYSQVIYQLLLIQEAMQYTICI